MSFQPDANGRACIKVTHEADGSSITVYQQGAHLTSWCTADGEEHMYTSPAAVYKDGKAIRGGVPLIFPQFSDMGDLPVSHGFLRTSQAWKINGCTLQQSSGMQELVLAYRLSPGEEPTFPGGSCDVIYTISFDATKLKLHVKVKNLAANSLHMAFAFHTYFGVADIRTVTVEGLSETPFLNNLEGRKPCPPCAIAKIDQEVDRIYTNQHDKPVVIHTHTATTGKPKVLTISGSNFKDTVLWNPWIQKAKDMSDLPDDDYTKFVCVEHGTILDKEEVRPASAWEASQSVTVSY